MENFDKECDKWEKIIKSQCCTKEEQKIISDCFVRLRDRYQNLCDEFDELSKEFHEKLKFLDTGLKNE
jgi:hypothetical protein